MTSKTILNGLNPICWGGVVPKMCPKKVADEDLELVPVAP